MLTIYDEEIINVQVRDWIKTILFLLACISLVTLISIIALICAFDSVTKRIDVLERKAGVVRFYNGKPL